MSPEDTNAVLAHMVKQGLLFDDAGLLSIGPEGERSFGYRNFKEIFSVFTSPPLFTVLHGRAELGQVHDASFLVRGGTEPVLLLAGRSWRVTNLDWPRRLAYVEPSEIPGRSRWLGSPGALHFDPCRAIRRVLVTGHCPASLSARAADRLANLQRDFPWLVDDATTIVRDPDGNIRWWTFGGLRSNAAVSAALRADTAGLAPVDNFTVPFRPEVDLQEVQAVIQHLRASDVEATVPVADKAVDSRKFSVCVPPSLAVREVRRRLTDGPGIAKLLSDPVRTATLAG